MSILSVANSPNTFIDNANLNKLTDNSNLDTSKKRYRHVNFIFHNKTPFQILVDVIEKESSPETPKSHPRFSEMAAPTLPPDVMAASTLPPDVMARLTLKPDLPIIQTISIGSIDKCSPDQFQKKIELLIKAPSSDYENSTFPIELEDKVSSCVLVNLTQQRLTWAKGKHISATFHPTKL